MQWPKEINDMFESFETLSSAGTTLLVPDCELTNFDPADAFYSKQWVYTGLIPIIVIVCVAVWSILPLCFKKLKKNAIDYMILSIVMLMFLGYPTLVKLSLSVSPICVVVVIVVVLLVLLVLLFLFVLFVLVLALVLVLVLVVRVLLPRPLFFSDTSCIPFSTDATLPKNWWYHVPHGFTARTMFCRPSHDLRPAGHHPTNHFVRHWTACSAS